MHTIDTDNNYHIKAVEIILSLYHAILVALGTHRHILHRQKQFLQTMPATGQRVPGSHKHKNHYAVITTIIAFIIVIVTLVCAPGLKSDNSGMCTRVETGSDPVQIWVSDADPVTTLMCTSKIFATNKHLLLHKRSPSWLKASALNHGDHASTHI